MRRYYLLALANFLAAIGGGAILRSGSASLTDFPKGVIVAFFIGITIGLFFQVLVPQRWSRTIAPWFSVAIGPVSLTLAWLFKVYAEGEKLRGGATYLFIALLSVRYALWFFSRALRAQTAGSKRQGIALIELGYYSGMVCGLVVREVSMYGMLIVLFVDALLQPIAGLIDLTNADGRKAPETVPAASGGAGKMSPVGADKASFDYGWYWRLTAAVVCLTIGFQAVPFSFKYKQDGLDMYVMAYFYSGVALAALFCMTFQIKFDWGPPGGWLAGNAMISSERTGLRLKANFGLITLAAAASMVAALAGSGLGLKAVSLALPFVAASAFIYQILVLSLLDSIGRAEKLAPLRERIKLTYLILGVGTVLSVMLLSYPDQNLSACVVVTVACSLVSFYAVRRRVVARA